jgi:hypothetical protein
MTIKLKRINCFNQRQRCRTEVILWTIKCDRVCNAEDEMHHQLNLYVLTLGLLVYIFSATGLQL